MKKRFLLLLAVLLLVVGALTLTACKKTTPPEDCTHQWGEWTVKTAATCSAEGTEERTCSLCQATETRSIAKTAHQYGTEWIGTAEGHHHKCLNCDAVSATEAHREGPEATSTTSQVCLDCGYILKHASAHRLEKHDAVDATCVTSGNMEYWSCLDCGANFSDEAGKTQINEVIIKALGHTWNNDDPGCTDDLECTVCHAVQPAEGHHYELTGSTPLSCTVDETETYTCSACGDTYTNTLTHATGHVVMGEWEKRGEPELVEGTTCTYEQIYYAACENCVGFTKTETLEIHHYGAAKLTTPATCKADGTKTYTCDGCGATRTESFADPTAHKWDNGKDVNGNTVYTCTVAGCGKTKTEYNTTTATVSKKDLTDEISLKDASLSLDETVKGKLGDSTTFTAEQISFADLGKELGKNADYLNDGALVFEFGIRNGENTVDFGGGKVTVRIPYVLSEDDDPDNIAVFYIDNDGNLNFYNATYVDGYAVFEADHFSTYTITRLSATQRCELYGHRYRDEVIDPTCEEEGYTISVCLRCREVTKHDIKAALGHKWTIVSETPDAVDCTHSKTIISKCDYCDKEVTVFTPALGHTWEEANRKDATCTAAGSVDKTCSTCHVSFTEILPQKAHSYQVETVKSTCTTDGYTVNTCTVCGYVFKNNFVTAMGHNFKETTVAHTCTEEGYTLQECRQCDYSCRINIVPASHTWDRATADCGHGQTCVICGAAGAPATGNHQMENGVCKVCGEGCAHNFTTGTVAATCEERGYTLKKCDKCGLEEKSNYTEALGHDGVVTCSRCGKDLIPDEYFKKLNETKLKDLTLRLNNAVVVIDDELDYEHQPMRIIFNFADISMSFDENGKITLGATGQVTGIYGLSHPTFTFRAALADGVIYLTYAGQPSQLFGSMNDEEFRNLMESAYCRIPVAAMIKAALSSGNGDERLNPGNGNLYDQADEAGQGPAAPSTDEILAVLMKKLPDMLKKLLDTVGNLTAGDSKEAGAAMTRHAILAFFDPALEGDDLVLTLNYTKIQNFLLCDTYADMIDYLCGDGTFTALLNKIYAIGDSTVAQIAGKINEAGLDYTKAYQELNDLIREASAGKCNTLEELLAMMGIDLGVDEETGKPLTVIDLLNRLIDSKMTVFELVCGMMSGPETEMTVADLKEMIAGMFNGNLIDTIAAMIPQGGNGDAKPDLSKNKDMVLKAIDFAVTALNRDLKIEVVIGKNAALKSVEINANIDISNYNSDEEGSVVVSLSLLTGEAGKLDIKTLADEINAKTDRIKLNKKSLSKYLNNDNYILEFDENDNLVSITLAKSATVKHLPNGTDIATGRDARGRYTLRIYGIKTYLIDTAYGIMISESCGATDLASLLTSTVTEFAIYKDYGMNVLVPYEGTEYDEKYTPYLHAEEGRDTLEFTYNTTTNKVTFTSVDTLHVWKEDKAAAKEATGCTGVGEIHYTCAKCGDTFTEFYVNGHLHTKAEGTFLTDEQDCTKGVRITTTCTDCGKVLSVKEYTNHQKVVLATIDCKELGGKCGGTITVEGCVCGMTDSYLNYNRLACENNVFNDWTRVNLSVNGETKSASIRVCGVDDPYCGFFWGSYTEPVTVGCLHGYRTTYVFGVKDQNDNYTVKKVVTGGIGSLSHAYSEMTADTKTYTLPKSGITVTLPILKCETCGYYCTYIDDKDSDGDLKHRGTIYSSFGTKESMYEVIGGTVGNGKYYFEIAESHFSDGSFALNMEEYYETGEFHVDEHKNSVKDHIMRYEREVFYGKDGNNGDRCHAVNRWYEDGVLRSDDIAESDACQYSSQWLQSPTCTAWGLYDVGVCEHCGYNSGEIHRGDPPHGHQFVESAKGYVCEVCGLKSRTGVNGSVYMEDLNRGDAATGYQNGFKFGYFSREYQIWEDYTPSVVLVPAGDADGEDLVLDLNMNADSTATQDYIEFTWEALAQAISTDCANVSGTYLLKFACVSNATGDANDYAITLDIEITIKNGQLVR